MTTVAMLAIVAGAIAVLFMLIMGLKLHAFVALLLTSVLTAVALGIPLEDVAETVEEGMGGVLGTVAVIVGLGAMFGQVLRVTGAAERIADTLVSAFGERRVPWSLGATGLIVAIPVFFDVALVLLIPLVYTLAKRLKKSLIVFALPLLAGLSAAHSLIPPTPGPVAAAGILGADLGWVILFGLLASIPAVILGGILYGRFIGQRVVVGVPEEMEEKVGGDGNGGGSENGGNGDRGKEDHGKADGGNGDDDGDEGNRPGFGLVLTILAVPLLLILGNTVADAVLDEDTLFARVIALVGDPMVALIIAVLLAFYVLGMRYGLGRSELQSVATKALEPVGMILLVTGAGGVLGEVLERSGVGDALEEVLEATALPIILLAFVAAAVLRVCLGSGTVATVTAAAIVAQAVEAQDLSAAMLGAIVVAIGAGATVLSHVNDSGFWLVNRFLGLTEKQTLVTWTVMQTIMGCAAFLTVLAISPML
ncbi:GntP family permease [Streptomyces calidiresistens]|uniref:Gluconate transporter n=1 Tax=Streptomyces calidiresistens TaxID=1485586 RepID=A0A7W3T1U9_9ACTN|nr:SLC13 family permease [Streptomyces calidiresistens]MBB0229392.1 gluconate transporter [Streptomyces calidiresistens]